LWVVCNFRQKSCFKKLTEVRLQVWEGGEWRGLGGKSEDLKQNGIRPETANVEQEYAAVEFMRF
jgi:hypothetical protein